MADDATPSTEPVEKSAEETSASASASPSPSPAAVPYSAFSKPQKQGIALLAGLAMMFSGLTANIYLPSVPALRDEYRTSLQLVNVTITAYVVVQGLAPAFLGELSDKIGRRPVYVFSFRGLQYSTYVVADGAALAERGGAPWLGRRWWRVIVGPVWAPLIGGPLSGMFYIIY